MTIPTILYADATNNIPKIQTSHAILLLSGSYILQLRDNKPTIAAPGKWSLFGGVRKYNESPLQIINREVMEELLIKPEYEYLWFKDYYSDFRRTFVRTWFFASEVSTVWSHHKLIEGQTAGIFTYNQLNALDIPAVMKNAIKLYERMKSKQRKDWDGALRAQD